VFRRLPGRPADPALIKIGVQSLRLSVQFMVMTLLGPLQVLQQQLSRAREARHYCAERNLRDCCDFLYDMSSSSRNTMTSRNSSGN